MSPSPADATRAELVAAARRELHSAQLLAADPSAGPLAAAPHLLALWRCLAWLSRGEVPEAPGPSLADWLAPAELAQLPSELHGPVLASLIAADAHVRAPLPGPVPDPDPDSGEVPDPDPSPDHAGRAPRPELPEPRQLLAELRALAGVLDALAGEGGQARARLRTLAWASVGLSLALALVAVIWRPWQRESGPWRAAYYPSKTFEGRPDHARVHAIDFDWGTTPPTESIPEDFYSARFDTCLVLDAPTEVAFMLVSDNGSRLHIDGQLRIDNWKTRRGPSVAGERVQLDAGVHHLLVEYFEDRGEAQLHLSASFDPSQAPAPIPSSMLRPPTAAPDEAQPCG